jgi:TATA-box binding protein (TBP) (component of TFIID and TFIIIB)
MASTSLLHPMDHKFELALKSMAEYKSCDLSCSNPYITTATIVCCLDVPVINLDDVRGNSLLDIRTTQKSKKKQYRAFSNSVTVLFDKTKAAKVFVNGKIHITGCTKVAQALSYSMKFCEAMRLHHATVKDVQILTLNTAFKIDPRQNIRLSELHETFQCIGTESIISRYNPDIYQGLVVKVMHPITRRKITTLIFYTGTMIVTGVRTDDELLHTQKIIMDEVAKASKRVLYTTKI